ncbi:hypothetical protein NE237_031911 [Protea cynaroides]|uniref:Stigma-specific Stig1 family protein n=1 Tax=Protea cynaroides TaxID=273540 RepID=A0A9Q0R2W5_9MAGN|nr:hypothetical protein NE237_031911 [Protea cynaroides]
MWLSCTQIALQLLCLLVLLEVMVVAEATNPMREGSLVPTSTMVSSSSPWLKRVTNPRATGCGLKPWICRSSEGFPPRLRKLCCRNRCVDVLTDVNNCGFCGIRCQFSWQCCNGFCVDTNVNLFHCGMCWNRCPFGSFCMYGLCGYAEPLPPVPFPLPQKLPRPPFPFPPRTHPATP